ncbi:MAG: glycoside hydrolase family 2 protein [Butyrivibrio sp.]|nr:glycoside hydrolase family 2 protein [Butyrivibrio sp.]
MQKIDFNEGWSYKRIDKEDEYKAVTLPHDAMLSENRSINNPGIHNLGYFEGGDYEYKKSFNLPEDYRNKDIILEFEGVYRSPEIYINGKLQKKWDYGYTERAFPAENLCFGEGKENENEIKVIAHNLDQPNSRWYSGSGIYRPVWMYVAEKEHIELGGVKVRTISTTPFDKTYRKGDAMIGLKVLTNTSASSENIRYRIFTNDEGKRLIASGSAPSNKETEIELKDVYLWSAKSPKLYTIEIEYKGDHTRENFGIRTLTWDRKNGMRVNGKRILLRGACIHSDNQLLGAVTDPDAEERRVKLLKKWGYNAIRSAHNPCSKYLLDACDKYGMYMMDEYVDMWYIHKNMHDYAGFVEKNYKEDLRAMVEKDYNHPCVVMYSTGNEVAETGEKRGIVLTRRMTEYLHELDASRPVSCGVNIFFNWLYSMGFGIYSDEKAKKDAENPGKKKTAVGSEFYNQMAGILGDTFMKVGAATYPCDVKTRDAFANMDIAGYNYGILRYKTDLKKYPERLILGSETFCKDAYKFYEFAKRNPGVIGDFVWAGQDYIGEAGIGSWEYEDYAPKNADPAGWLTAGSGRLDITGRPLGEAYYTLVALDRKKGPFIAVKPVYQTGKHTPSAWKMTDAIRSWSYDGCEGYRSEVEVYARAEEVELFVNGVSEGRKKGKDCVFRFTVSYRKGTIEAVSYDKYGNEIGRDSLSTAGSKNIITIKPEEECVCKGHLSYIRIAITDENGVVKPMEKDRIKVSVTGGELLALGNACPYNPDGYLKDETFTYYGEMLAIVRAQEAGKLTLTATGQKNGSSSCTIDIR